MNSEIRDPNSETSNSGPTCHYNCGKSSCVVYPSEFLHSDFGIHSEIGTLNSEFGTHAVDALFNSDNTTTRGNCFEIPGSWLTSINAAPTSVQSLRIRS